MATKLKKVTGTGMVVAGPCWLKSAHLTAAAANSTAAIQDTTAGGGTDFLALAALANSYDAWTSVDDDGVYIALGIYVSAIAGASASLSVEYEA